MSVLSPVPPYQHSPTGKDAVLMTGDE